MFLLVVGVGVWVWVGVCGALQFLALFVRVCLYSVVIWHAQFIGAIVKLVIIFGMLRACHYVAFKKLHLDLDW